MTAPLAFLNLGVQEILVILFLVIPVILFITALVQIVQSQFKDPSMKLIWVLIVLLVPAIGSLLWFIIGRGQTISD